ncbi:MAG: cobalamin-independent methionine synthase II family protein [Phycisphaeraceae bacterium]|nr:cobalamin-independent methionine synthase II family protein [Phycisphaeraceae bacterium]
MKTTRTKKLPLFYTHVIGSLPRPRMVRDLLDQQDRMSPKDYKAALDDVVRFAIRLQELAGLDVVSDGEWRRRHYVGEFLQRIGGFEKIRPFEHAGEKKMHDVVTHKITASKPVWAKDAQFLVANTTRFRKFALPSPFLIAIRYWHQDFSTRAYPTIQHFMEHLTKILRKEAVALVDAGIDIIQLDDPALTYFCDRRLMGSGDTHDDRLRRGWDIDKQFPEAINAINGIVDGLKAEIHLHCCHSVYKRQSDVHGDYKPILPRLKDALIDRVNIEFAYHETGVPDDLKLLPARLGVGMGVVDVRGEKLQTVDEIEAIGAAGAKIIDPSRIALNPDCGFAPDFGEPPTIDEAYEKLSRMCEAAKRLRVKHKSKAKR